MELRDLRYFTAVAQWTAIARRPNTFTWPSHPLAKLFSRQGRVARLTPEGQVFYVEAIKTLEQAETAIATAQRAAKGEISRLGIGFVGARDLHVSP